MTLFDPEITLDTRLGVAYRTALIQEQLGQTVRKILTSWQPFRGQVTVSYEPTKSAGFLKYTLRVATTPENIGYFLASIESMDLGYIGTFLEFEIFNLTDPYADPIRPSTIGAS